MPNPVKPKPNLAGGLSKNRPIAGDPAQGLPVNPLAWNDVSVDPVNRHAGKPFGLV